MMVWTSPESPSVIQDHLGLLSTCCMNLAKHVKYCILKRAIYVINHNMNLAKHVKHYILKRAIYAQYKKQYIIWAYLSFDVPP